MNSTRLVLLLVGQVISNCSKNQANETRFCTVENGDNVLLTCEANKGDGRKWVGPNPKNVSEIKDFFTYVENIDINPGIINRYKYRIIVNETNSRYDLHIQQFSVQEEGVYRCYITDNNNILNERIYNVTMNDHKPPTSSIYGSIWYDHTGISIYNQTTTKDINGNMKDLTESGNIETVFIVSSLVFCLFLGVGLFVYFSVTGKNCVYFIWNKADDRGDEGNDFGNSSSSSYRTRQNSRSDITAFGLHENIAVSGGQVFQVESTRNPSTSARQQQLNYVEIEFVPSSSRRPVVPFRKRRTLYSDIDHFAISPIQQDFAADGSDIGTNANDNTLD